MCIGTSRLLHRSVGEHGSLLARGRHQGSIAACRDGVLFEFVMARNYLLCLCLFGCFSILSLLQRSICSLAAHLAALIQQYFLWFAITAEMKEPQSTRYALPPSPTRSYLYSHETEGGLSLPKTQPREALSCRIDPPNE